MGDFVTIVACVAPIVIAILGFFLKSTMAKLDKATEMGIENKNEIGLLKLEIKHTNSKVDEIFSMLKEISTDIKMINKTISEKKN